MDTVWRWLVRRVAWLVLAAVAVFVVVAIYVRHTWPHVMTADDIAIVGSGLTLAATWLAFRAASESRDAANESRQALRLHYRPSQVRVAFTLRDPNDLVSGFPWGKVSTTPWVQLIFYQPFLPEYRLEWVDTDGDTHTATVIPTGAEESFSLTGIAAFEDKSGPFWQVRAVLPQLRLTCRDQHTRTVWRAAHQWPAESALGSYLFEVEPDPSSP